DPIGIFHVLKTTGTKSINSYTVKCQSMGQILKGGCKGEIDLLLRFHTEQPVIPFYFAFVIIIVQCFVYRLAAIEPAQIVRFGIYGSHYPELLTDDLPSEWKAHGIYRILIFGKDFLHGRRKVEVPRIRYLVVDDLVYLRRLASKGAYTQKKAQCIYV